MGEVESSQSGRRMKKFTSWLFRNKHLLLLFLVISIGVVLRVFAAYKSFVTFDAGIYMSQAYRVSVGEIPQRDFLAVAPPYLYVLALWGKLFGFTLLSGRMLSLVCGAIIIPLLYLIGRDLVNKKVGLVAALIFALSPPGIFWMLSIEHRSLLVLLIVLMVYLIQKCLREHKPRWGILGGFVLGIAIWTGIRDTVFLIAVPVLFFIVCYLKESAFKPSLKLWGRYTAWFVLGVALFAVPFGLYLAFNSSFEWLRYIYISGGGSSVVAAGKNPFFDFLFSNEIKGKVIYTVVKEHLFIIIPAFIFFAWAIRDFFKKSTSLISHLIISLTGVALFAVVIWGKSLPLCGFGTYPDDYPRIGFIYLLVLGTALAVPLFATLSSSSGLKERHRFLFIIVIWCVVTLLVSHAVDEYWHVAYFLPFGPILAIMAGFVIVELLEGRLNFGGQRNSYYYGLVMLLIAFIVLSAGLSGIMLSDKLTNFPDRPYAPSSINRAAQFIREHSETDDEVFTTIALINVAANRKMFGNYDNPWLFLTDIGCEEPFPYDPYNIVPSIGDIKQGMESGEIKLLTWDWLTRAIFLKYPQLDEAFKRHYYLEESFGGGLEIGIIRVYSWQPVIWNLCDHIGDINAYMDSTELYFSEENKSWMDDRGGTVITPTDRFGVKVGTEARSDQLQFHSDLYKPGGSSYIKFTLPDNPYTKLETSYGLADGAVGVTDGVIYKIKISADGGVTYTELLSAEIHQSAWTTRIIDIEGYKGQDVTFLLESNSIKSCDCDWLTITFTLRCK